MAITPFFRHSFIRALFPLNEKEAQNLKKIGVDLGNRLS